jgi:hypothetical protein
MAHHCPECKEVCRCSGDDELAINPAPDDCKHCDELESDEEEEFDEGELDELEEADPVR